MGTNYSTMQITLAVNDALQFAKIMVDAGVKFALVGSFEPMQPMATEQAPLTSVKEEEVKPTPKSRKAPNKAKRKIKVKLPLKKPIAPKWPKDKPRSGPDWGAFLKQRNEWRAAANRWDLAHKNAAKAAKKK